MAEVFGGNHSSLFDIWLVKLSPEFGIEENNPNSPTTLSPNPATNEIKITNAELRIKEIEIYDVVGMKCLTPTLSEVEGVRVDVSSLAEGIYFVTVRDEKGNRVTKKFVKM